MRLDPAVKVKLVEHLLTLVGQTVVIESSLSRSRLVGGHDRHFATSMRFQMTLRSVLWFISGSQLSLRDDHGTYYGLCTDVIAMAHWEADGSAEIIEHFEAKTERRTRVIPQVRRPSAASDDRRG